MTLVPGRKITSHPKSKTVLGKVAFVFLALVQFLLVVMIFYQRFIQWRPAPYYNDLAILLGISSVGFWLVNFYLGGALPALSIIKGSLIYLLLVASIAIPHLVITPVRGVPTDKNWFWFTWTLVILGIPAVLVGGYSLAAYLGKRRLDKLTSQEDNA